MKKYWQSTCVMLSIVPLYNRETLRSVYYPHGDLQVHHIAWCCLHAGASDIRLYPLLKVAKW